MLNGLEQLIVYVDDMKSQATFYVDQLGLKIVKRGEGGPIEDETYLKLQTGECSLALHLNRYGFERPPKNSNLPKFAFSVPNVEETHARLLERGVGMEEVREVAPGVVICDGSDPEGNRFAIITETIPAGTSS